MSIKTYKTLEGVTTDHPALNVRHSASSRDPLKSLNSALFFGQVVLYSRKSTDTENAGKSIEDQNECNMETVIEYGLPADETCTRKEDVGHGGDEWWRGGGHSGVKGDEKGAGGERYRPVLTEIVEGIVAGTVKCVVCYAQDRLWRDVGIADAMIDLFIRYNVLLFDRHGPVCIDTPEGRSSVRQNAVSAQAYRERVAQDSARGTRKNREKGKLVVNSSVLGFRSGGRYSRVVIPKPDELEMVRRVFRLFVYGEGDNGPMGCSQIAKLLMEERYAWTPDLIGTRGAKRNEYTEAMIYDWQIKKVLTDCRYQGRQPHAGQEWECPAFLVDGKPAVDVALYERAQAKLLADKRVGNASNGVRALTGLIRCGLCAQGLQASAPTYTRKDGTVFRTPYWKNVKAESWC